MPCENREHLNGLSVAIPDSGVESGVFGGMKQYWKRQTERMEVVFLGLDVTGCRCKQSVVE